MIRSATRKVSTSTKTNEKLGRAVEKANPMMEGLEGRQLMSTTYLSDMTPTSATNGWGQYEKDMSNGEKAANDGGQLNIAGTKYTKGLGVHAGSTLTYNLGGNYDQFKASVGVDREVGSRGSVVFQAYLDGKKVYDSGKMVGNQAAKNLTLNTSGKNTLKLVVTDAGNGNSLDHADWADARLISSDTSGNTGGSTGGTTTTPTAPTAPTSLTATAASTSQIDLSWKDNASDETGYKVERSTDGTNFTQVGQVGASVTSFQDTGLTAGTKYYYRVRATNEAGNSAYTSVANATTTAASTGGGGTSTGGGSTSTGAKPTAANTGPTNESILKSSGSITVNTDGAVIENVNVSGTITINASNVTVRNFKLNTGGAYGIVVGANAKNVVIEDGEITGTHTAAIYGPGWTARRLEIHHTGGDALKPWSNVVIDGNYIHHLGMDAGSHADGIQESGGSNITITNNNIDMPEHSEGGQTYLSNAAIFIHSYFGGVSNIKIDNNWLNGGNYTIYSIDGGKGFGNPTGVSITNNKFGRDYNYGTRNTTGSVTWSGNTWQDNGSVIS